MKIAILDPGASLANEWDIELKIEQVQIFLNIVIFLTSFKLFFESVSSYLVTSDAYVWEFSMYLRFDVYDAGFPVGSPKFRNGKICPQ